MIKNIKVVRVSDIWDWSISTLVTNLVETKYYNGNETNQNYLMNDFSSIIFGYAIIKQKRIKNGKSQIDHM